MIPFSLNTLTKKINIKVWLILCFLLFLSTLLHARGINFKDGETISVLPFQNIHGLIVMQFTLENEEVNLILDSGIRNIVLFDKPGSYGLKSKSGKSILFSGIGSGKSIRGRLFHEINIKAPNIEGSGLSVAIVPIKTIPENLSLEINGLIGYDVFSRFLVKIDFLHSKVILQHPKEFAPGLSYQKKELELIDTKPFIKYVFSYPGLEEHELKLFIDTGGNFSMILNNFFFPDHSKKKKKVLGYGLSGSFNGFSYSLNDVYIDHNLFDNFSLWIPTTGVFKSRELVYERDGSLGNMYLHKFDEVVFDYSNKFVYFKPKQEYLGNGFWDMGNSN